MSLFIPLTTKRKNRINRSGDLAKNTPQNCKVPGGRSTTPDSELRVRLVNGAAVQL